MNNAEDPSFVVTRVVGPNERANEQEEASIGDEDAPQPSNDL